MAKSYDVVIVGGGPIGMGVAIKLGQRGVRCVVVERYEQPQPISKGQNLTQRTMEHFHAWGAEKQLRAARTIPPEYGIGGLTAYRILLGPYSYDWLQRELVKSQRWMRCRTAFVRLWCAKASATDPWPRTNKACST